MAVILVFIVFVTIGDVMNFGICSVIEVYSENVSLMVFLSLFIGVFIVAWQLAVRFTERYIEPPTQPEVKSTKPNAPAQRPLSAGR